MPFIILQQNMKYLPTYLTKYNRTCVLKTDEKNQRRYILFIYPKTQHVDVNSPLIDTVLTQLVSKSQQDFFVTTDKIILNF